MKDFKDLNVWQKAHGLALRVYQVTRNFPKEELYGLTSQIRRSASSISANIAEGCGRRSDREFARFLQIARGSSSELECHLMLARDLHLLPASDFDNVNKLVVEVQRMLASLVQRIRPAAPFQ